MAHPLLPRIENVLKKWRVIEVISPEESLPLYEDVARAMGITVDQLLDRDEASIKKWEEEWGSKPCTCLVCREQRGEVK